jgi:hypothetical protein
VSTTTAPTFFASTPTVLTITLAAATERKAAIVCSVNWLTTPNTASAGTATIITKDGSGNFDIINGLPFSAIGALTAVSFTIAAAARGARRTSVKVTLAFTTMQALSTANGKIILKYPNGFFAKKATPTFAAGDASVATMTGTCAAPGATSIVITTATAGIPAATAFTITFSGATLGGQNNGSSIGITVLTDADVVASIGVASGAIYFAPYDVSLTIAAVD